MESGDQEIVDLGMKERRTCYFLEVPNLYFNSLPAAPTTHINEI